MKFILVRHEQGAVHMADGYARATGKPAVVLVTSGPGAGNTVTGIMTAQMDSRADDRLCGQQVTWMLGKDAFQEADIFGITPGREAQLPGQEANDIPGSPARPIHIATTGRPGPVLIDVPKDVSQGPFTGTFDEPMDLPGYIPKAAFKIRPATTHHQKPRACSQVAKRPVILAGQGAMIARAGKELLRLAESSAARHQHPAGQGRLPRNAPALARHARHARHRLRQQGDGEADLIIQSAPALTTASSASRHMFGRNAKIIHIDIDPGGVRQDDQARRHDRRRREGRADRAAPARRPPDTEDWLAHLDGYKKKYPLSYKKQGGLRMQQVLDELYKLTKGKAIITTDVGQHQMWAAQFYKNDEELPLAQLRRRRHHGLRLPRRHRRAARLPGTRRSWPSSATAASR
jgi:acetolactate synthase-1/2/3 large subunit